MWSKNQPSACSFLQKRWLHIITTQPSEKHNIVTCKDVRIEPQLQSLTSQSFTPSTARENEVGLGVCARGFWRASQIAFFGVRVFKPNARIYAKQELSNS